MSDLIGKIKARQVRSAENVVIENLRAMGLDDSPTPEETKCLNCARLAAEVERLNKIADDAIKAASGYQKDLMKANGQLSQETEPLLELDLDYYAKTWPGLKLQLVGKQALGGGDENG